MLCSLRQPVGRCLDSSRSSSTMSSSCAGKPLPHPRQCPHAAVASCPRADPARTTSHFQVSRCGDGSDPGDGSSGAAKAAAVAASGKAALRRLQPAAGRQRVKAV